MPFINQPYIVLRGIVEAQPEEISVGNDRAILARITFADWRPGRSLAIIMSPVQLPRLTKSFIERQPVTLLGSAMWPHGDALVIEGCTETNERWIERLTR